MISCKNFEKTHRGALFASFSAGRRVGAVPAAQVGRGAARAVVALLAETERECEYGCVCVCEREKKNEREIDRERAALQVTIALVVERTAFKVELFTF